MEQEHQDDDARGEPATPSTPSTTTQGETQRPAGPDGLGGPGSRKHAPGTPPQRTTHAIHSENQEPTTHDHTNCDPGTAGTTGPLGGGDDKGGSVTMPTGTGTRPNPITTYRLLRHMLNRKYRNTPAYPKPGPHGVQPEHKLQPHNAGRHLRPGTGPEPVTAHGLQRPNHEPNHKPHAVQAYTKPRPHGVQRPRHGPLQHASPRSAAPRQPGQLPGTGTTNGDNGGGDNTAKRARGPRTRSTTIRVQWHIRHRDGNPLPTIRPS